MRAGAIPSFQDTEPVGKPERARYPGPLPAQRIERAAGPQHVTHFSDRLLQIHDQQRRKCLCLAHGLHRLGLAVSVVLAEQLMALPLEFGQPLRLVM
jgi:hypothetical protein